MLESIKQSLGLLLKNERAVLPRVGSAGGGGAHAQCSWGKLTAEPPLQQQQSAVLCIASATCTVFCLHSVTCSAHQCCAELRALEVAALQILGLLLPPLHRCMQQPWRSLALLRSFRVGRDLCDAKRNCIRGNVSSNFPKISDTDPSEQSATSW